MKRTFSILLFLVILISCGKNLNDPALTPTKLATNNAVVVAPDPASTIDDDYVVTDGLKTPLTIISAPDYNSLDYKTRIFFTGLRNTAQYLLQDENNADLSHDSHEYQFDNDFQLELGYYIMNVME